MEEIILVSDNHGVRKPLQYLLDTYPITDYFIHCGDSEMHPYELNGFVSVQGNNDYYHSFPNERIITIGKHNILVVHGHLHMFFAQPKQLVQVAKKVGCDIVFYGHTHIPNDILIDGVRCLNPGSAWHNRDGSKPSYMVIQFNNDEIHVEKKQFPKF